MGIRASLRLRVLRPVAGGRRLDVAQQAERWLVEQRVLGEVQEEERIVLHLVEHPGAQIAGELLLAADAAEVEQHVQFQEFLRIGVVDPVGELLAPDGPRQVPPRVLGHDAALAIRVADLVEPVADQGPHGEEVLGHFLGVVRVRVVIEQGVVLIGQEGLFLAALASQSQEGEPDRGRPQLLGRHLDQFLHHGVGDSGHDVVDVSRLGAGVDDGLHQRGQAVVSLEDVVDRSVPGVSSR